MYEDEQKKARCIKLNRLGARITVYFNCRQLNPGEVSYSKWIKRKTFILGVLAFDAQYSRITMLEQEETQDPVLIASLPINAAEL